MNPRLIYFALMACVLAGCNLRPKEHFAQKPVSVRVDVVDRTTTVFAHTYVGDIEESDNVPLGMPAGGRVVAVNCRTGQQVRAGQVLVEVDSTRAHELCQSARASLRQAEDGYRRAQAVYAEGGITEQKMVEIATQLAQARALANVAEQGLADCSLVAPVSGTVGQCNVRVGQQVAPAVTIVTLLDMEGFNVTFAVPEKEVSQLNIGDRGWVDVAAVNETQLPVRIVEKSPVANRIARTYEVTACLERVPQQIMPGMIAGVKLMSQQKSGFLVPRSAVTLYEDRPSLWVANDSVAVRRTVAVGENVSDSLLVTDGLEKGDKVIVAGIQKLWQGAPITY